MQTNSELKVNLWLRCVLLTSTLTTHWRVNWTIPSGIQQCKTSLNFMEVVVNLPTSCHGLSRRQYVKCQPTTPPSRVVRTAWNKVVPFSKRKPLINASSRNFFNNTKPMKTLLCRLLRSQSIHRSAPKHAKTTQRSSYISWQRQIRQNLQHIGQTNLQKVA